MVLSLALCVLLIVSLAGKVVVASRGQISESNDASPIVEQLQGRGLLVSLPAPNTAPAWVTGTRNSCRVRIVDVAPQGWSRTIVREQATGEALSFAFAGRFYDDQPVMRTRMEDYRIRLLRYFGMRASGPVVRAVAISPGCPADIIRAADAIPLSQ